MNRSCFRIVFSRARGQLMAVAETACSQTQGNGATHKPLRKPRWHTPPAWPVNALMASLFCTPALVNSQTALNSATVQADSQVAANLQPQVSTAPNGTSMVHIQAPTAAGVSRNVYQRFDVPERGVILNNATVEAQTRLAGWVQANPMLTQGAAKVILNEVNSPHASQLAGAIEVAGQKAALVLANPSGITCSGCGFINASQVTLTTGTPLINAMGGLDGYRVTGGHIEIQGKGMDARGLDFAALLARSVRLNAAVWADQLQLITGRNEVDSNLTKVQPITGHERASTPAFAIDVSQLGGMYAGKIRLVGTEWGVGVRQEGSIQAGTQGLVLHHNGRLENRGATLSAGAMNLSLQSLENAEQGSLYAQGDLQAQVAEAAANKGLMAAGQHMVVQTGSASNTGWMAAGLNVSGVLSGAANLTLDAADEWLDRGHLRASGQMRASAQSLQLAGTDLSAAHVVLQTPGHLSTHGAKLVAAQGLEISAGSLNNREGTIGALSGAVNLNTQQAVDNRGGLISAAGALAVTARQLDNSHGGELLGGTVKLTLPGDGIATDAPPAELISSAFIDASVFDTPNGQWVQPSMGLPTVSGNHSVIDKEGRLWVFVPKPATANLDNSQGGLISATQDLQVRSGSINNNQGLIQAGGQIDLDTQGGMLMNASGAYASLTWRELMRLSPAQRQALRLAAQQAPRTSGEASAVSAKTTGIVAGGGLGIRTASLINHQGLITAEGPVSITRQSVGSPYFFEVQSERMRGLQPLAWDSPRHDVFDNRDAGIVYSTTHDLHIDGWTVQNQAGGLLLAGRDLTIGAIDNQNGQVKAGRDLKVHTDASTHLTLEGRFMAGHHLWVKTGSMDSGATMLSLGDITLELLDSVGRGAMSHRADFTIGEGQAWRRPFTFVPHDPLGIGETAADAQGWGTNLEGTLKANRRITVSIGALSPASLSAEVNPFLRAEDVVDKGFSSSADITAGERIDITGHWFRNSGTLEAPEVRIDLTEGQVNLAQASAGYGDFPGSSFVNARGRVYGDRVSIRASEVVNGLPGDMVEDNIARLPGAGLIAARQHLYMGFDHLSNQEGSQIISLGDAVLQGYHVGDAAQTLVNHDSQILVSGSLSMQVNQTHNQSGHWFNGEWQPSAATRSEQNIWWFAALSDGVRHSADQVSLSTVIDGTRTPINHMQWHTLYDMPRGSAITLTLPDGSSTDQWQVGYDQIARLTPRTAATISVGGDLTLRGQAITNTMASIVVGNFLFSDASLNNQSYPLIEQTSQWQLGDIVVGQVALDVTGLTQSFSTTARDLVRPTVTTQAGSALPVTSIPSPAPLPQPEPAQSVAGYSEPSRSLPGPGGTSVGIGTPGLQWPSGGLYQAAPDAGRPYLVETDPRFLNGKPWLSSDYLLGQLGTPPATGTPTPVASSQASATTFDPSAIAKRLGDGFYEQQLVREQVAQLTGRRFLGDFTNDEAQFKHLMEAAASVASPLNLRVGLALTAEQVAMLTTDIVWLVERTIDLPDARHTMRRVKVLVPQVYAKLDGNSVQRNGALVSAKVIDLDTQGQISNSGTLMADVMALQADGISADHGSFMARQMALLAQQDIRLNNAVLSSQNDLMLMAGRQLSIGHSQLEGHNLWLSAKSDITLEDNLLKGRGALDIQTAAGSVVTRDSTLQARQLRVEADQNVMLQGGSSVANTVDVRAGQRLQLEGARTHADGSVHMQGAQVSLQTRSGADGARTQIDGQGISLVATEGALEASGVALSAQSGVLLLQGKQGLTLSTQAQRTARTETAQSSDWVGDPTSQVQPRELTHQLTRQTIEETAVLNDLSGAGVQLLTGGKLSVQGTQLASSGDVTLQGDAVNLQAGKETRRMESELVSTLDRSRRTVRASTVMEREVTNQIQASGALSVLSTGSPADPSNSLLLSGTRLSGHSVLVQSAGNLTLDRSLAGALNAADGGLTLRSQGDLDVAAQHIVSGGDLALFSSGGNINLLAQQVVNGGNISLERGHLQAQGDLILGAAGKVQANSTLMEAGGSATLYGRQGVDLKANLVQTETRTTQQAGGWTTTLHTVDQSVTSTAITADGIAISSDEGKVTGQSAQLNAQAGDLSILGHDGVELGALMAVDSLGRVAEFVGRKAKHNRTETEAGTDQQIEAGSLSGANVSIRSGGGDISLQGTDIRAEQDLLLSGASVSVSTQMATDSSVSTVSARRLQEARTTQDQDTVGGTLSAGQNLSVQATHNVALTGVQASAEQGQVLVQAQNNVQLLAVTEVDKESTSRASGRKLRNRSQTESTDETSQGVQLTGQNVTVIAGNELSGVGATLQASGEALLVANSVDLKAAVDTDTRMDIASGKRWSRSSQSSEQHTTGGLLSGDQGVRVLAQGTLGDVLLQGMLVQSANGNVNVTAQGQVQLTTVTLASQQLQEEYRKKKSTFSSKTTTSRSEATSTTAQGSTLSGATVEVTAGQNIEVKGSQLISDSLTQLKAGQNVLIQADQNTLDASQSSSVKRSGLMSSGGGGVGFSVGSRSQATTQVQQSTLAANSTVASLKGDVNIAAGTLYQQTGSDVITPQGSINIQAQQVLIDAARETSQDQQTTRFKQSGFTVSLSNPVAEAVQKADQMQKAASQTQDSRMKALAAMTTVLAANNAYSEVMKDPANLGGVSLSVSVGSSRSQSQSTQSAESARGAQVQAGQNISIQAQATGTQPQAASNLSLLGSSLQAGGNIALQAQGDVSLKAAQQTSSLHSRDSSSGASLGVALKVSGKDTGISVNASANKAKGRGDGSETTWANTLVDAGQQLSITSGADTTLQGAVAKGQQVVVNTGGQLNLQSLQDTSTYDSKSSSMGVGVSVCVWGPCTSSANASMGKTRIDSDFASVAERTGIQAGDQGFQVNVAGKTDLQGAVIASTDKAVQEGKNTLNTQGLSTSDIQNKAEFKAQAYSVSVSTSAGQSSAGFGKASDQAASTTTAGVSGIAGDTSVRTGDQQQGLATIFDKDKVSKDVNAQVTITAEFGKQAAKAVGDYASQQQKALKLQADEAFKAGDTERAAQLQADSDKWAEGGTYRVATHTVVGGLGGGLAGVAGAGVSARAAPGLEALQNQLQSGLEQAGVNASVAKGLAGLASGATAATLGGVLGGGAGAASAFNQDANNRQLHPSERRLAQELSKKSDGKYTPQQIEEQLRLMGVKGGIAPDSLAVLKSQGDILLSLQNDPTMPKIVQGAVILERPGVSDMEIQSYIMSNAQHPEVPSIYIMSRPSQPQPVLSSSPPALPSARCANGDTPCITGIGQQHSHAINSDALANGASIVGRQAGIIGAAATAAAAAAPPTLRPIAGTVAVGATAVGMTADTVEQIARPDAKKVFKEQLLLGVPAEVLTQRFPQFAPLINEIKETLK